MPWRQWVPPSNIVGNDKVRHPAERYFASKRKSAKSPRNHWSELEDARVLQLRQDGKRPEDMLEHFPERSLAAIEGRMYGPLRPQLVELGLLQTYEVPLAKNDIARIHLLRSQGLPWREILQDYPGRTLQAIKKKIKSSGRSLPPEEPPKRRLFEEWEDELLLHYRKELSLRWPDICTRMPHRTSGTLWNRYRLLVRNSERVFIPRASVYTQSERDNVINLRNSGMSWVDIAKNLGKTGTFGIRMQYTREKFFKDEAPKRGPWTEDEDRRLRALSASRDKRAWIEDAVRELRRAPTAINYRHWHLKNMEARRSGERGKMAE